jgi:hypothetical protein
MNSCDYNNKPETAIKYVKISKIKYDCLRFSDEASERLYSARKIITVVGTTVSIFSAAFGNLFRIGLTGIYRTIGIIMMIPVPLLTILICPLGGQR